MLRPFFPELVMSTDLLNFEHPTVLLICLTKDSQDKDNMYPIIGSRNVIDRTNLQLCEIHEMGNEIIYRLQHFLLQQNAFHQQSHLTAN